MLEVGWLGERVLLKGTHSIDVHMFHRFVLKNVPHATQRGDRV